MTTGDPLHVDLKGQREPADARDCASSIADDFAALVEILERQLAFVSPSDRETRLHISKAKAAAERGLSLSRKLVERMQSIP